jgi:hypothetical protein
MIIVPMTTFSRETTALDPWYVTGLCEARASFTFSRSGRQIAIYFSMRAGPRSLPLLEALRSFFGGAGTIYPLAGRSRDGLGPRSGAGYYYRICRREELALVVAHFDRYPLRGDAAGESFATWKEMVSLKQRFRRPSTAEMEALAARLSAAASGREERT